jgi:hypothetical protein
VRGSKTVASKEVQFRQHYLSTGNASASARAAGLPVNTGVDLAKRANADKKFVKAREEIYARAMVDGERMLFAGMEVALERLNQDPLETVKKLQEMARPKKGPGSRSAGGRVQFQDSGAQYLRSMAASLDVIAKIRKFDAELKGEITPANAEVRIVVTTTEAADGEAEQGD